MAAAVSFESRLTGSLKIKGDITGRDALLVDAQVSGRIQLDGGSVTVGPHGQVNASINAREIDIHGQLKGDLHGHDRVRIGATGQTNGQIVSRRVAIEDGAIVRGRVEVTHHASADGPKPEQAAASHAVAAPSGQAGRSTPGPVAVPSPAKEPTAAA
jgi:cytoskeletal protein CcmA (bactofilin family)